MRKYVTTFAESTGRSTSARITISYYSLTRQPSPRIFETIYFHAGSTVVSTSSLPKESAEAMCRNISTAFLIFRRFNDLRLLGRSPRIADISLPRFTRLWTKRYLKSDTATICRQALSSMEELGRSFPGWHMRLVYSPNVLDLVRQLATCVYSSILQLEEFRRSTAATA